MGDDGEASVRDVGKLWSAITEIKGAIDTLKAWAEGKVREFEIVLMGPAGDNGMRGNLKNMAARQNVLERRMSINEDKIREAEAWGKHVWEVERPAQCLGVAEVKRLEAKMAAEEKERAEAKERDRRELRQLKWALFGTIAACLITSVSTVAAAFISARGGR